MDFKFSIGQFVTTGESKTAYDWCKSQRSGELAFKSSSMPIALTIIERRSVECSGGVQIGYLCRYYTAAGYTEHWFGEIELVEHPNLKQWQLSGEGAVLCPEAGGGAKDSGEREEEGT